MPHETRVFILGAGASKTENAPLTWEFLYESFLLAKQAPQHPLGKAWKKLGKLLDLLYGTHSFFASFGGHNRYAEQLKTINLEEVFTLIETAIQRKEGFSSEFTPKTLEQVRENLIFIIGKTLSEKLQGAGHSNKHLSFVRNHVESDSQAKNVIVSFNYDILIDNVLEDERTNGKGSYVYGGAFGNYVDPDGSRSLGPYLFEGENPILLLKPHGSLNWLLCPTCGEVTCFLYRKIFDSIYEPHGRGFHNNPLLTCTRDNTRLTQTIIPPTFQKDFSQRIYQDIWNLFRDSVTDADHIFLLGYSLPEADLQTRYSLKHALARNRKRSLKVTIVNKVEQRHDQDVYARLKSFFGSRYKYEEVNGGFEEFALEAET